MATLLVNLRHHKNLTPPISLGTPVYSHTMLPRVQSEQQAYALANCVRATLLTAVVIFSTAQLAGLLFRNALVASAASLIALLMQLVWFVFVADWTHTDPESEVLIACLGVLPLPLSWLLMSRWYAGRWILEQPNRAIRGRLCAWLLAPWLLAACGIIGFRIFEIPGIGIEPPTRQQLLMLSTEELQIAEMYQSVAAAVAQPVRVCQFCLAR